MRGGQHRACKAQAALKHTYRPCPVCVHVAGTPSHPPRSLPLPPLLTCSSCCLSSTRMLLTSLSTKRIAARAHMHAWGGRVAVDVTGISGRQPAETHMGSVRCSRTKHDDDSATEPLTMEEVALAGAVGTHDDVDLGAEWVRLEPVLVALEAQQLDRLDVHCANCALCAARCVKEARCRVVSIRCPERNRGVAWPQCEVRRARANERRFELVRSAPRHTCEWSASRTDLG